MLSVLFLMSISVHCKAAASPLRIPVSIRTLILNGTRDKPRRYHGVLGADYETACHAIHKGGYATDPGYPGKLIGLIEKYGLAKYDKEETSVKPEVANEIISHLQGQWAFYNQMGMKDEAVRIG